MPASKDTRRFCRSLTLAARDQGAPAEVLIHWLSAILAGHGEPNIEFIDGEWTVTWPAHGEVASTMAEKQWAWTQLRQAGWGLPVQQIQLEAQIQSQTTVTDGKIPKGALSPAQLAALRDSIRGALTAPASTEVPTSDDEDETDDE